MPLYHYICDYCNIDYDITKPMHLSTQDEPCSMCNRPMRRTFNVGMIKPRGNNEKGWTNVDWKGRKPPTGQDVNNG